MNPRLTTELMENYKGISKFRASPHFIFIRSWRDIVQKWLPTYYKLTKPEVQQIMDEWQPEWKVPIEYKVPPQQDEGKQEQNLGNVGDVNNLWDIGIDIPSNNPVSGK